MKARIVGGEFDGVEFEVSVETVEEIKESTKYSDVKEYCRANKVYSCYNAKFVEAKTLGGYNHVCVPLPEANEDWTFAAFDWVKAFCEHFRDKHYCWPHHISSLDCANYLWIEV